MRTSIHTILFMTSIIVYSYYVGLYMSVYKFSVCTYISIYVNAKCKFCDAIH